MHSGTSVNGCYSFSGLSVDITAFPGHLLTSLPYISKMTTSHFQPLYLWASPPANTMDVTIALFAHYGVFSDFEDITHFLDPLTKDASSEVAMFLGPGWFSQPV